jgi:hypothetical protein
VKRTLANWKLETEYYSLAINENTDVSNAAQLVKFVRGVNEVRRQQHSQISDFCRWS